MKALWLALLFLPCTALAQCYTIPCHSGAPSSAIVGGHTFTYRLATDQGGTCSGASCTITIPATSVNSVLAIVTYTATNVTISSVSGCSATWTTGTSSNFTVFSAGGGGMNLAFAPTNTGGCTSVVVTLSGSATGWDTIIDEYDVAGTGPAVVDQLASSNLNSSACTSCTLSAYTGLTGTSDLQMQAVNYGGSGATIGSPYAFDDAKGFVYLLNSASGTAPVLTQPNAYAQSLGVALQ